MKSFFAKLTIVLVLFAILIATQWGKYADRAMLRNVDDGVALGDKAAQAIGAYYLKQGRYPQGLEDLPVKIEATPMSNVTLSPQAGEVMVTLTNQRFAGIAGKRMYFKPQIKDGKVERVVCRTDDEEFRKLIDGRCD